MKANLFNQELRSIRQLSTKLNRVNRAHVRQTGEELKSVERSLQSLENLSTILRDTRVELNTLLRKV